MSIYEFDGWPEFYWKEGHTNWTRESLQEMWDKAGGDPTEFCTLAAERKYAECVPYYCANKCCIIDWHPLLGNVGGFGRAGCSCDDLTDPRGPEPVAYKQGENHE